MPITEHDSQDRQLTAKNSEFMEANAAFDEGIKHFRKTDHFREDSKTNLIFHQLDDDHLPPLITKGSI